MNPLPPKKWFQLKTWFGGHIFHPFFFGGTPCPNDFTEKKKTSQLQQTRNEFVSETRWLQAESQPLPRSRRVAPNAATDSPKDKKMHRFTGGKKKKRTEIFPQVLGATLRNLSPNSQLMFFFDISGWVWNSSPTSYFREGFPHSTCSWGHFCQPNSPWATYLGISHLPKKNSVDLFPWDAPRIRNKQIWFNLRDPLRVGNNPDHCYWRIFSTRKTETPGEANRFFHPLSVQLFFTASLTRTAVFQIEKSLAGR